MKESNEEFQVRREDEKRSEKREREAVNCWKSGSPDP
jgi:hypothetical protein